MTITVSPLATWQDFESFGSNAELVQNEEVWTTLAKTKLMNRATRRIESMCNRRLAPFTGLIESQEAYGIDPDEYGSQGSMPMDITGALGWSQAAALGVSDMVRKFWLDQSCPQYADYWSITVESILILRTFGDTQLINDAGLLTVQGPNYDTGLVKLQIGTYCPIGSTVVFTYSGGYTVQIPEDLNLACILQAMKFALIGAEPELRKDMSSKELDDEITMLLAPFASM